MTTNVPARSGATYWWNLTDDQRKHYERCITAIVAYYDRDIERINLLIELAVDCHWTDHAVICAVLWRLQEEISND